MQEISRREGGDTSSPNWRNMHEDARELNNNTEDVEDVLEDLPACGGRFQGGRKA